MCIYLVCVDSDWDPKGTGQAEICQLNYTFIVNEQVLGLQVSMQNPPTVAEQNPLQDLIKVTLHKRHTPARLLPDTHSTIPYYKTYAIIKH